MKRISKYLALILRHKPEAGDLSLDSQGWAEVESVLDAVRRRFGDFDRARLEELVRTNDKKRYAFNEAGDRIRASQGHSIKVDLDLVPVHPPPLLYHGTAERFAGSVIERGLLKGGRHHVHLSDDVETALKVGRRRGAAVAVLEVRSGDMPDESFFLSANGVWLTDHVPPQYLRLLSSREIQP